ncbi:MAG TPA: acetate kinase [Gimesia maris]|uniref:Acetate kinase n=1 Tax=Gimesia maris TaxID=122 RepID=A0A3D3R8R0_9PLAN|nr:acetate kinase [Gimesia maris]
MAAKGALISMSILVLNAGSSTLKFALFDEMACDEHAGGAVDWQGASETARLTFRSPSKTCEASDANVVNYEDAVRWILQSLRHNGFNDPIRMVGHRLVHGGIEFRQPTIVDARVYQLLESVSGLAPLHNPHALITINATRCVLPDAVQAASFDTAFFAELPARTFIYPVPYEWYEQYGIRRFGFHGISHAYCTTRAAELLNRQNDPSLCLVICHLGNGCSATAVRGGHPVATTMGFTPLEGLMMGTRSGSIDPGIMLHLLREQGFVADQLADALNHRSGLLGVSNVSSDFREVQQAADSGNDRAQLAIEMFADRIRSTIGSLAVTLGGVDALVFTAGIGEHSYQLRRLVLNGLECLGLQLDEDKNQHCRADCEIASNQSSGRILVIHTREEQMIARETHQLLINH